MEQLSSTSKCQNYFSLFFSPCSLNFMVEALISRFLILSLFEAVIPLHRSLSLLALLQWDPHAGAGGSWP